MRTIGVDIDTLADFMHEGGTLYTKGAEALEPKMRELHRIFEAYGNPVIYLQEDHTPESEEISATPDFESTYPAHGMRGSAGAGFVGSTKPKSPYVIERAAVSIDERALRVTREIVLKKDSVDVFDKNGNSLAGKVFDAYMENGKGRAFVWGTVEEICVDNTIRGLVARGYEVFAVEDAILTLGGRPSPKPEWQLMEVKFVRTEQVEQYLR